MGSLKELVSPESSAWDPSENQLVGRLPLGIPQRTSWLGGWQKLVKQHCGKLQGMQVPNHSGHTIGKTFPRQVKREEVNKGYVNSNNEHL